MARAILIVAALVDVLLAALLIGVSGFILGAGPESLHGDALVTAGWTAMIVGCIAAPVLGFVLRAFHRPVGGILLAWLPPLVALAAMAIPPRY